jgi:hypothetical protein
MGNDYEEMANFLCLSIKDVLVVDFVGTEWGQLNKGLAIDQGLIVSPSAYGVGCPKG